MKRSNNAKLIYLERDLVKYKKNKFKLFIIKRKIKKLNRIIDYEVRGKKIPTFIEKLSWFWKNYKGTRYRIVYTENLKNDEILISGYRIYLPHSEKNDIIKKEG